MISMPSIRWSIFGATFGITIFTLLIQINSTEKIDRHFNSFQNEQNTTTPYSNPDFGISDSKQLSEGTVESNFPGILSNSHKEYLHRYKQSNLIPPVPAYNSSELTMIENQLKKMQDKLAYLNSSASLSTEDKSRISELEITIKETQAILDSFQKEYSGTMQVIINNLETAIQIAIEQSIKSGHFSFAEEQLPSNNYSIYEKVVQNVYDNQADNIDLLLRFGDSITDLEKKFKLYEALYHKIKNNGHLDIRILFRLGQSLRKGIVEIATGTIEKKAQLLIHLLCEGNRNISVTLITDAFQNFQTDESLPSVNQIADEIRRSCGLKFLGDIYNEVIRNIMGKKNIKHNIGEILYRVDQNVNMPEDRIMIHEEIINKMEHKGLLHDDSVVFLVHHMKKTFDDPRLNEDWRNRFKIIINKLPRSLRYIILSSSSLCIKNSHYNEYLYAADSGYMMDGHRRVFTGVPKNKQESSEFRWKIDFNGLFTVTIQNVRYNEFLNIHKGNGTKRYYAVMKDLSLWRFYIDEEGIEMSHDMLRNEHVAVDDKKQNDNMRNVFLYEEQLDEPSYQSKWEIDDCSNIS